MNAHAAIGHNNPPTDLTPFDLSSREIEDLFVEGRNWLTGETVTTQAEADAIGKLLDLTGSAIRLAETRRKDEVKPFDEAKAEVQARFNGLIGDTKSVTGRAIVLQRALQAAVTPWREKQREAHRLAAEAAREVAERKAREAALAFQVTTPSDLEGREHAEELARDAKAADAAAKKANKPVASGLRPITTAAITDATAFARWAWVHHPDALRVLLQRLADDLCAAKIRDIPGVEITTTRVAR